MVDRDITWTSALADAGCFDFLLTVAANAVSKALCLCPEAEALLGDDACSDMRELCLVRLREIYERSLTLCAVKRVSLGQSIAAAAGGEARNAVMRSIADDVCKEVMSDAGASLRERHPLALEYERAIICNFVDFISEFLGRLSRHREGISIRLLGGKPVTRLLGISTSGADPHRHGRMVMRVTTDAGEFFYKPHDCGLDALYLELVKTWFPSNARAASLVSEDGYAFVEKLVPAELSGEDELRTYWRNLGALTALFHALGSRDMTMDNIMCCGGRPAALDLETLITGKLPLVDDASVQEAAEWGIPADMVEPSAICTAILPKSYGGRFFSPLLADNRSGTCLPRACGKSHTVRGYEGDFELGFEEGYRRLVRHRGDVLATLRRHKDAVCRQLILNTWAYAKTRSQLFGPRAMSDPGLRDKVLREHRGKYSSFDPNLVERVAEPDVKALLEGDIPYYCSRAGSRALYANEDDPALGDLLERSALEVAAGRIENLSEDDLSFELGVIRSSLSASG